jgi:hypothetical protein
MVLVDAQPYSGALFVAVLLQFGRSPVVTVLPEREMVLIDVQLRSQTSLIVVQSDAGTTDSNPPFEVKLTYCLPS